MLLGTLRTSGAVGAALLGLLVGGGVAHAVPLAGAPVRGVEVGEPIAWFGDEYQRLSWDLDQTRAALEVMRVESGGAPATFAFMRAKEMGLLPNVEGRSRSEIEAEQERLLSSLRALEVRARILLAGRGIDPARYAYASPNLARLVDLLEVWGRFRGTKNPPDGEVQFLAQISPGTWDPAEMLSSLSSIPEDLRGALVPDVRALVQLIPAREMLPIGFQRMRALASELGYEPSLADLSRLSYASEEEYQSFVGFLRKAKEVTEVQLWGPLGPLYEESKNGDRYLAGWTSRQLRALATLWNEHRIPLTPETVGLIGGMIAPSSSESPKNDRVLEQLLLRVAPDGREPGFSTSLEEARYAIELEAAKEPAVRERVIDGIDRAARWLGRKPTSREIHSLAAVFLGDRRAGRAPVRPEEFVPQESVRPEGDELSLFRVKDFHIWRLLTLEERSLTRAELTAWIAARIRPGTPRADFEGTLYRASFAEAAWRLSLPELHKIRRVLIAIESGDFIARVQDEIALDDERKWAEVGGRVVGSHLAFEEVPSMQRDNNAHIPPPGTSYSDAVVHFHTHERPASGDRQVLAGPSQGDLEVNHTYDQDGIVLTPLSSSGRGSVNIDFNFVRRDPLVVDIGNF